MDIILYGTEEFNQFVNNSANVSPQEAWEKQLNFYKNNPSHWSIDYYRSSSRLFFIADGHYVYTLSHINQKIIEGMLLEGIWINAMTGEAKYVNNSTFLKAKSNSGLGGE